MSSYNVPVDYVDLNSPVEVVAVRVELNPLGNLCFVTLRNLERMALEVRLSLYLFDEFGRPIGQAPHIEALIRDLSVPRLQEFGADCPIQIGGLHPATVRVEIVSVTNDNGKGVNRTRNIVPMLPPRLVAPQDVYYLHVMAGKDAQNLFSQEGPLWRCVCGRTNAQTQTICMRCHRDYAVVAKYDADGLIARRAVEQRAERTQRLEMPQPAPPPMPVGPAVPPAPDYQDMMGAPLAVKKKKVSVGAVCLLLMCLMILGAGGYFAYDYGLFGPGQSYRLGQSYFDQERYAEAQEAFAGVTYKDSEQMAKYSEAFELRRRGQLKEAAVLFEELGEFKDSAGLKDECRYARMEDCLRQKEYAAALEMMRMLGSYKEADKDLGECIFNAAGELLRKNDPAGAKVLFEEVADQFSVSDRIMECDYQLAVQVMDGGDYEQSIEAFTAISKYRDSAARVREAKYLLARQLAQGGNAKRAADLFGELGSYKDSQAQFNETCYAAGQKLWSEGKQDAAREFFGMIPDYKDARSYGIGQQEYDYRRAADLRTKKQYREASDAYLKLGNYRDSAQLAVLCQDDALTEGSPFSELKVVLQKLKNLGSYSGAAERIAADKYIKVRLEGTWRDAQGNFFKCTLSGNSGYYCESSMPMYDDLLSSRFRGSYYEVGREGTEYKPQFEFLTITDSEITVFNYTDNKSYTLKKG